MYVKKYGDPLKSFQGMVLSHEEPGNRFYLRKPREKKKKESRVAHVL